MSPNAILRFYGPVLRPNRLCHLRSEAGEFLKDLCLMLDNGGDANAFWAAWEAHLVAAVEVGSRLNDIEHWKRFRLSREAVREAFASLVSAVFLNGMHFRVDQDWRPLAGQTGRFGRAFKALNVFALNDYISFLGTIGGSLLPGAWVEISDCVRHLVENAGRSFLSGTSSGHLLRLIGKEASLHRVPDEDPYPFFSPLKEQSRDLVSFYDDIWLEPITKIVSTRYDDQPSVCGLVVKNPFFQKAKPIPKVKTQNSALPGIAFPQHLICGVQDWHPIEQVADKYKLLRIEGMHLGDCLILHPVCTWNAIINHPFAQSKGSIKPLPPSNILFTDPLEHLRKRRRRKR